MTAKTGQDLWICPGQSQHFRPILFARAVDDHSPHAFAGGRVNQFGLPSGKAVVLKMVVSVVEGQANKNGGLRDTAPNG